MTRARTVVVGLVLLAAAIAAWFLVARERSDSLAAPPGRPKVVLPGSVVLEGRGDTEDALPHLERPSREGTDETGSLEGTILRWDGAPCARKWLVLESNDTGAGDAPYSTLTDDQGRYSFPVLGADWSGALVVRISDGYHFRTEQPFSNRACRRCDVVVPEPATLRVRLTSMTDEQPRLWMVGVTWASRSCQLRSDEPHNPWQLRLEEEGRVATALVGPGEVTLRASVFSAPSVSARAVLESARTTEVVMRVPGDGIVTGRVVDAQGRALEYGLVAWLGPSTVFGTTDPEGRFRLFGTGKKAAPLTASAFVDGGQHVEGRLQEVVPDGEPVQIVVGEPLLVTLRTEGLPAGTELTVATFAHGQRSPSRKVTPVDGRVQVDVAPDEQTRLVLSTPGFAPVLIDLPVTPHRVSRDLGTVRFVRGVELNGSVRDTAGAPLPDVYIAVAEEWSEARAKTDGLGRFRLDHLPERPTLLRVQGAELPLHLFRLDPSAGVDADLVLTREMVAVRVVGTDGRPVVEASVTVSPPDELLLDGARDKARWSFDVDREGRALVPMCLGPCRVSAESRDGRWSGTSTVTVRRGTTTEVSLVVRP